MTERLLSTGRLPPSRLTDSARCLTRVHVCECSDVRRLHDDMWLVLVRREAVGLLIRPGAYVVQRRRADRASCTTQGGAWFADIETTRRSDCSYLYRRR